MERNQTIICKCGGKPHRGTRCRECVNASQARQQAVRRAKEPKSICKCGQAIGLGSTRCRACNVADIAPSTQMRIKPKNSASPLLFQGLRGKGGEMPAILSGKGGMLYIPNRSRL